MVQPTAEQDCLSCHNGHVGSRNIAAEFGKLSVHPVTAAERHDPREDLLNPPRHVECADCHDPHAAAAGGAASPRASGALQAVRGVSAAGSALSEPSPGSTSCASAATPTAPPAARRG